MLRGHRWNPIRAVAIVGAVALVAAPVLAQAQAAVTLGAESPQAVVEQMKKAGGEEDFAAMAALMAPEDRAVLSFTMVMMLGMVMTFAQMGGDMAAGMAEGMAEGLSAEEKAAAEAERQEALDEVAALEGRYQEILDRYELEAVMAQELGPDTDPQALLAGVDQVGLIRDLTRLLDEIPGDEEDGEGPSGPVDVPVGDLEGLQIDGDTATGTLDGEAVKFVKVDGRWFVSLGMKEKLQQGMGGVPMPSVDEEPAADSPDSP